MDAVLFLKEWKRMCDSFVNVCFCCKLHELNICSVGGVINNPEKAVEIVEKWSRENPVKTMIDDFFEKFPNAEKDDDGSPTVCVEQLGYPKIKIDGLDCNSTCLRCWSRPLEVKE